MTPRVQRWAGLGALLVGVAAAVALSQQPSIGIAPARAAVLHLILLAACLAAIRWFPARRHAVPLILLASVAARLALLPMTPSDDVHRYVWEGRVLLDGSDPYRLPPKSDALKHLRTPDWEAINNKQMTAIYPPGALLVFRELARWAPDPERFKRALVLVDLAVVGLLLGLLRSLRRRPEWALLYALNPITLLAFAGEGHLDALLLAGLLSAVLLHHNRRFGWAFLFLGLSIHMKYVSILLLPFFVDRNSLRWAWAFAVGLVAPVVPFLPAEGLTTSLATFTTAMHYNGSIHRLLGAGLEDYPLASSLCAIALAGWVVAVRVCIPRLPEAGALVFAGLVLLSPTVHPWYLTWVLPFLCIVPLRPMLLFCATIAISYVTLGHLHHTGEWREFPVAIFWEYAPVYVLLLVAWVRFPRPSRRADARPLAPVRGLSILVPTLNEVETLPAFIEHTRTLDDGRLEILLCDGGSTDGTRDLPLPANARFIDAPRGRGTQVAGGVDEAVGDVLLIAHSDLRIDASVPDRIRNALNRSDSPGGCVGCRFEPASPYLRIIALLNALRARFAGISFGDQGQFVRRDALAGLGGFPALPLMEDVELSFRLRAHRPPLYLGGGLTASARRWDASSKRTHTLLVLRLVALYSLRRIRHGPHVDATDLYRMYYRTSP